MMEKEEILYTILSRSLALYSRLGIKSVTMDDIARELGMSKKTLYQFISDKLELVSQVVDHELQIHSESIHEVRRAGGNAIDELIEANRLIHNIRSVHGPSFYYDLRKYYPELFRRWLGEKRHRLYDTIVSNLLKGKKEGLYRSEMDEHIIARLYVARMEMFTSSEIMDEEELFAGKFIREVFLYHLHGICNENGRKYLSEQIERLGS